MVKTYFPKVKEAREALRERAIELFESYLALAAEARAAGEYEVAEQVLWKLIEHMPDEEGTRLVESSIDKQKQVEAPKGPTIQIGIALGGMGTQKQLPQAEVIDIDPKESK